MSHSFIGTLNILTKPGFTTDDLEKVLETASEQVGYELFEEMPEENPWLRLEVDTTNLSGMNPIDQMVTAFDNHENVIGAVVAEHATLSAHVSFVYSHGISEDVYMQFRDNYLMGMINQLEELRKRRTVDHYATTASMQNGR